MGRRSKQARGLARGASPGEALIGRPTDGLALTLVIEVDGLLQRFGRAVPDGVALLEGIARLRAQAAAGKARLEIVLARFGSAECTRLENDLTTLGLAPLMERLGAGGRLFADGATLAVPGERVMLFAGRWTPARQALALGMPAYLVGDRREGDHRQLAIEEAPRVLAESLGLAVPRPMSPNSRRGSLIMLPPAGPADRQARGTDLLRHDLHADWFALGQHQIVYVENGEVTASLLVGGGTLLASQVRLAEVGLARPGECVRRGETLFVHDGFRLGQFEGEGAPWRMIRRASLAPDTLAAIETAGPAIPGPTAALLASQFGPWHGPAPTLADDAGFDIPFARYVATPTNGTDAGPILAFVADKGSAAALRAFAASMERHPDRCAAIFCRATVPPQEAIRRILWDQELNRLARTIPVKIGDVARSDMVVDDALSRARRYASSG